MRRSYSQFSRLWSHCEESFKANKDCRVRYCRRFETRTCCIYTYYIEQTSSQEDSNRSSTGVWQWVCGNIFCILSWTTSICLLSLHFRFVLRTMASSTLIILWFSTDFPFCLSVSQSPAGSDRLPVLTACEGRTGLCGLKRAELQCLEASGNDRRIWTFPAGWGRVLSHGCEG